MRQRLVKWGRQRYKRYKTNLNKAYEWLGQVRKQYPSLFYHWRLGFS
jgi:RNA-directed DNA polymerase